jgi:hypothetical protein
MFFAKTGARRQAGLVKLAMPPGNLGKFSGMASDDTSPRNDKPRRRPDIGNIIAFSISDNFAMEQT